MGFTIWTHQLTALFSGSTWFPNVRPTIEAVRDDPLAACVALQLANEDGALSLSYEPTTLTWTLGLRAPRAN